LDFWLRGFADADELSETPAIAELDNARDAGKKRVVLAQTYVLARLIAGAALADKYGAAGYQLARELFNSEPLRIRIAPVF
jgi:hypothetical protein